MPVIYTKTALKKIKKDDLIDFYLSQQQKMSQLTNEYESYAMDHPCEMNCKHCGLTTTEDDLGISLDCGELTCEGCFEEGKSKPLKEENKELKDLCEKQVKAYSVSLDNRLKLREGLDKWVESHAKWVKRAALLKEEKEKLKEENNRMFRFLDSREIKYCEKCREYNEETEGFGFNGVFQDSEGKWICDDCHEEPPDQCEICDKTFDLHYTMNQCDGNLREKYDDYFGSEKDQGDVCPDCINTIC